MYISFKKSTLKGIIIEIKTYSTESSGILKCHWRSNINVAGITNKSPSWWTLATQNTAIVHMEGLEVNFKKI